MKANKFNSKGGIENQQTSVDIVRVSELHCCFQFTIAFMAILLISLKQQWIALPFDVASILLDLSLYSITVSVFSSLLFLSFAFSLRSVQLTEVEIFKCSETVRNTCYNKLTWPSRSSASCKNRTCSTFWRHSITFQLVLPVAIPFSISIFSF